MKKLISILMSLFLGLELISCGNSSVKDFKKEGANISNSPTNIKTNDCNSNDNNNDKINNTNINPSSMNKSLPSSKNINNDTSKNNKESSHSNIFDKNKAIEIAMYKYGSSPNLEYALIDYGTENNMKYYNLVVKETLDGQVKSTVIDNIKVFEDGTIKGKGGLIIK